MQHTHDRAAPPEGPRIASGPGGSRRGYPPRAGAGFSLIELLIGIVIVGILTAIAMPMYQNYTMTARRSTAHSAMHDAASRQEQFLLDNKSYTSAVGTGGLNLATTVEGGYYALSIDTATAGCPIAQCYVLRATPQGTQADDSCGNLTLSSDSQTLPADCW